MWPGVGGSETAKVVQYHTRVILYLKTVENFMNLFEYFKKLIRLKLKYVAHSSIAKYQDAKIKFKINKNITKTFSIDVSILYQPIISCDGITVISCISNINVKWNVAIVNSADNFNVQIAFHSEIFKPYTQSLSCPNLKL